MSWRQAEAFLLLIQKIMDYQSQDANKQSMMHPPAVFTYPPKNYRFNVYVKAFDDADNPGTSIVLTPGKFNQRWRLVLFIVQDSSTALVTAGDSHGVVNKQAEAAIAQYMARISDGIGWTFSQYTGISGGAALAKDMQLAVKLYPPPPSSVGASSNPGSPGGLVGSGGPAKTILQSTAAQFGWTGSEWSAMDWLEMSEAGYNVNAKNPSSGAYGMAQSLGHPFSGGPAPNGVNEYGGNGLTPAQSKAASMGDAGAQSLWMCNYVKSTYGTPSAAKAFHLAHNWY